MEIDLQQGLAEIADDAPTAHLDPDALWRHGVRRRNRRRAAAAGAVVAVMALVAGAVGLAATPGALDREAPPAAEPGARAALPDTLWGASPWTPGTDRAGAPGRIAVLFWDNAQRQGFWGSTGGGYVTVSAVDGRYRYLDAPGLAANGDGNVSLSPDGRYVAYPVHDGAAVDGGSAREWRVYDAGTGEVLRHRFRDLPQGAASQTDVVWTPDSTTLLIDLCRVTRATASEQACRGARTEVWDVASDRTNGLPFGTAATVVGRTAEDVLVHERGQLMELDVRRGTAVHLGRVPSGPTRSLLSATLTRDGAILVTGPGDTNEGRITLGFLPLRGGRPDGAPRTLTELDGDTGQVAGQLRDGRLVLAGGSPLVTVHDAAGRSTPLVRAARDFDGAWPQIALDLADRPTVQAPRPDAPTNPRVLAAGGAGVVALLAGLGMAVRRRRLRGAAA